MFLFLGWGGEDDDLSHRLHISGYSIVRYDPSISRYSMLRHRKEAATSRVNVDVDDQSESTSSAGDNANLDPSDGVRQVDYSVVQSSLKPLFAHVVLKLWPWHEKCRYSLKTDLLPNQPKSLGRCLSRQIFPLLEQLWEIHSSPTQSCSLYQELCDFELQQCNFRLRGDQILFEKVLAYFVHRAFRSFNSHRSILAQIIWWRHSIKICFLFILFSST